ncbi:MAG TPA: thiamine pyrophosphate-binding protein, partial [Candidatus Lokiarchaeia archaeon]|nr:thiamine pyrophosphate-binding protein [Candidatus Lokiarchaeia archaeon]
NPDGHTLALYDGLMQTEGIQHVLFNDERTAAFAADAYARVTGTLGVCDAGAAGSMNFPIALAEANGAASPVLAIIGVVKTHDILRNVPHDINVAETLAPVTKWTGRVVAPDQLPRFLSYAIRQAINGRPGSVALVVPEDVFNSTDVKMREFVPEGGGACSINGCRVAPAEGEVDFAVKLLQQAKQPAFFTGGGAVLSEAFHEVDELSHMLRAPVFTTISGKGILLAENDLHFGTVGLFGEKPNHAFLRTKADLLVVVGNRLTEDDTAYFKIPPPRLRMIQIDIDPAIIGLSYHPWGVVGDPKTALGQILDKLHSFGIVAGGETDAILQEREKNLEDLRATHEKYREKDSASWMASDPVKPQRVLQSISNVLSGGDFLVTDASASARWIGAYFPVKSLGRKIITARGVGPTGFGLGGLIGTCIAAEDASASKSGKPRKVLFTGDGGLMSGGLSDLETFQKLGLEGTIVVINNNALGFVKFGQKMLYKGQVYDTDRPSTDFARFAEVFGGTGSTVEHLSQLDDTISEAVNGTGLQIVDVKVDPEELLPPNFY